jgi:hypothetical protein
MFLVSLPAVFRAYKKRSLGALNPVVFAYESNVGLGKRLAFYQLNSVDAVWAV